jgi:hypothetical protein
MQMHDRSITKWKEKELFILTWKKKKKTVFSSTSKTKDLQKLFVHKKSVWMNCMVKIGLTGNNTLISCKNVSLNLTADAKIC